MGLQYFDTCYVAWLRTFLVNKVDTFKNLKC